MFCAWRWRLSPSTGIHALSGLQDKTENLGKRQLVAAELLGGMQERAKDNVALIALHLYVNDGDLSQQDEQFAEIEENWAKSKADGAKLEQLFKGSTIDREFAAWVAIRTQMLELQKQALEASRNETVSNAEDRSGSRTVYERQLLPLDNDMEAAATKLSAATIANAETAVKQANATYATARA